MHKWFVSQSLQVAVGADIEYSIGYIQCRQEQHAYSNYKRLVLYHTKTYCSWLTNALCAILWVVESRTAHCAIASLRHWAVWCPIRYGEALIKILRFYTCSRVCHKYIPATPSPPTPSTRLVLLNSIGYIGLRAAESRIVTAVQSAIASTKQTGQTSHWSWVRNAYSR